jgi:hypothetical protein
MGVTGIFEELRRGIEAGDRLDVLEKFQNLFVDPRTLSSPERQTCRLCKKVRPFTQTLIFIPVINYALYIIRYTPQNYSLWKSFIFEDLR